ncbi:ABC transporter ATP-binding protein [Gandjariella thermophila]|uniref:Mannosyltransferase n=1 Tax=Gandjariella thermophila TaxID=1931992 RepID=A0A4D4JBG2_9PSEU|nr:ABC transporter ATP-binding protein [Gandjariella thermophila]GDY32682.1 mannosyltransferase [Gandjariella thermophila]
MTHSDPSPPAIELRDVTKRFRTPAGSVHTALRRLNLTVAPGEFCAVVGPTGCGKSTTLSLISGLEPASRGEVLVDGGPVRGISEGIAFVFQNDAVFPWKSVLANVAAGPLFRGVPRREAVEQARDWLRRVGLAGFEDRHPHQLSGGMRKRVALAQSLINRPRILLMDEPFAALDVQTRQIMSDELLRLWELTRPAVVFITHDLEEAIALADKVVVLTAGPGTVKATFEVGLPRPRRAQEIRFDAAFVEMYQRIWESLRDEVELAYARTAAAPPSTAEPEKETL